MYFFRERLEAANSFYKEVEEYRNYIYELIELLPLETSVLESEIDFLQEDISSLQRELDTILASHKKPFTNTDDLQDYLNSLAQNKETTPEDPAKVPVADGTEIETS